MDQQWRDEEARNYAEEIARCQRMTQVDSMKVIKSLSLLGQSEDEENYRKIVDSFVRLAKRLGQENELDKRLSENPLNYLEFLCIGIDHGFTALGFGWDGRKLSVKENQSYFNKYYGGHFY